jgi:hypothetical protein
VSEQEAITGISGGGSSNSPPSLSGIPANSVKIGDSYLFQPNASDSDGDALSFTIQNRPGWAEFDATSGRVSGLPLLGDEGVYGDITISVSDSSDTSSLAFSVTVTSSGGSSNSPPSLSGIPANSVKIGDSYLFQPNAFDSDGDALSFTIQNRPGWAEFDATSGRVSGMPLLGDEGV